jgi:signal transduction histidine kinase
VTESLTVPAGAMDALAAASLRALTDLVAVLAADGTIGALSRGWADHAGVPTDQLEGRPFSEVVHPDDHARLGEFLTAAVAPHTTYRLPLRIWDHQRQAPRLDVSVTPVRDNALLIVARNHAPGRARQARRVARVALRAAAKERRRLAFDLHDGVLQALAGTSLRLATVDRLLVDDPEEAARHLVDIAEILLGEQRELRFHIEDLKEASARQHDGTAQDARDRLTELARRLHLVWRIRMQVEVIGDGVLPDLLQRGIFRIVQEALINSARHGAATEAFVQLRLEPRYIAIHIRDDGCGFSFRGSLNDAELRRQKKGPAVLKYRVWALGGTLGISSAEGGAALDVMIPVRQP